MEVRTQQVRRVSPLTLPGSTRRRGAAPELPPVPSGWATLAGADLARGFIERLQARVAALDAAAVRDLVAEGEAITSSRKVYKRKRIHGTAGEEIALSLSRIRPGQTQISYDRVREKILELLDAIAASPDDVVTRFLAGDRLTGFISESGREVIVTDGHHKLMALFALRGLVGATLCGGTHVPMLLTEPRDLFLAGRNGRVRRAPPAEFSLLEDNPYRKLMADVAAKVTGTAGDFEVSGADRPLWLKGPTAPEFVEFELAQRVEAALDRAGRPWKGGELDDESRAIVRRTLLALADDETFALHPRRGALALPEDWTRAEVTERIRVGRKRGKLRLVSSPAEC